MTKQAEREYAIKVDPTHLYGKPFNDPRVFREFAVVLEAFGPRIPGGSILDIGCGPGWTSLMLAEAGYRVLGVDISERMIEIANDRRDRDGSTAEFQVGDMDCLDLARSDFDGAMFFDCLHHCPQWPDALKRAYAHLRPGGYLLLMETTLLHRYSPHAHEVTREFGVTELGFSRSQLRWGLRDAGFREITFYFDPGPFYRGFFGFLKAWAGLAFGYFFYFPQLKNIVIARKPLA
jgi:SAM-dependent methyltransferase